MQFIKPTWPAPKNIRAYTTTRQQGRSQHPYSSFNLADNIGDDPKNVANNRLLLATSLNLPSEPVWLQQVHSNRVITINHHTIENEAADAAVTTSQNTVCIVTTADCLPILICNQNGTKVAAIHAGWKGLLKGIIENTIDALEETPSKLLAWLGPAIGPQVFEVSQDVFEPFMEHNRQSIAAFKAKDTENKWLANIYLLATQRLNALGLTAIYGGEYCTYTDHKNFYSYRRDHGITGRMATLIWLSA